jgi:hypothetical protein
VDLYVDVDALRELARQLDEVKASLERANDNVNRSSDALGSGRLADAVGDFVDGWRDGRKHLIDDVDGLLRRIQTAVDTYLEQESQLSKASGGET